MKKLNSLILFIALFIPFSGVARSVENKIALVDLQKIEEKSLVSQDLSKKLQAKEKELQGNLLKRREKLESDVKTIESKKAVLSREELEKKARSVQMSAQQLQIDEKVYEQTFQMSRGIALQDVQEAVQKAVNKVSVGKYDMVLPSAAILYADSSKFDDITDKVIKQVDSIIKTVDYNKAYKTADEQVKKMLKNSQGKK